MGSSLNYFSDPRIARILILAFFLLPLALFSSQAKGKGGKKKRKKTPVSRPIMGRSRLENGDSPEFQQFLQRLKEVRKGSPVQASILILGDSHMQCEDFGFQLTRYFQDSLRIPNAGRGFVFPYPLARTSHRSEMEFKPNSGWQGCRFTREQNSCAWGIAGWTAHCQQDSVEFSWRSTQNPFRKGDEIILFSPAGMAQDFTLQVKDSLGRAFPLNYSGKNLGFSGFLPFPGSDLRISIRRKRPEAEFVLQGLLIRPNASGLVTGISGTNGARLDHYLLSPDFQRHLQVVRPSLVVLSLGTNDAFSSPFSPEAIRNHLQQLLTRIKSALPETAILLAGPPDHCFRRGRVNPRTAQLNKVYSEIAGSLDFVFWNQQRAMGGKSSVLKWRKRGLVTRDMVHFTSAGYALQARLLGAAIKAEFR